MFTLIDILQVSEPVLPVPVVVPPPINVPIHRPAATECMQRLHVEVAPSLKSMLEKMSLTNDTRGTAKVEQDGDKITPGTSCKNSGCKAAARETNLAISVAQKAVCRHDWFQLPGQVTVSIYAKATLPDTVVVEANQTRLSVRFDFGADRQHFEQTFDLFGVRVFIRI
ncbi:unnamed protein product [Echinostoma caproni]|uniref:MSHA biogenesis protein MshL n=1 Tax=Echinostoma caproni TaxID=27848 RepID=A0A183B0S7_9TREM|nr:unnamed protein product [Echinostoma caproni]